jgi:hypothetical protein
MGYPVHCPEALVLNSNEDPLIL